MPPSRSTQRLPFLSIHRSDGQPTIQIDWIWTVQQFLELIHLDCKPEIVRHVGLEGNDAHQLAILSHQWASTVPGLNGHRQLDQLLAIHHPFSGTDTGDDTGPQAMGIPHSQNRLTVSELV